MGTDLKDDGGGTDLRDDDGGTDLRDNGGYKPEGRGWWYRIEG